MKILLTNDDGIYAEGLWALYDHLSEMHTVTIVAPDRERSAVGHGITLHEPLRAETVTVNGHGAGIAVNGTPADCVKLAVKELLETPPDMVVSGINPGANIGVNLNYSGTVSAAKEAALYGIPAVAASVHGRSGRHYIEASRFIGGLVAKVMQQGLPSGTFLNVNLPDLPLREMAGVRISRQALSILSETFEKRKDPRDQLYFWQGCDRLTALDSPETDSGALRDNFISITPIKCDMTDYGMMESLKGWMNINSYFAE
jgi:5'-nucleotidase